MIFNSTIYAREAKYYSLQLYYLVFWKNYLKKRIYLKAYISNIISLKVN